MALEGKKSSDKWFPVILIDDDDFKTRKTGVAVGSITVKYQYEAATSQQAYSPAAADWEESGNGEYWIRIGAAEFTNEGKYQVSVASNDCLTYNFVVEVRDKTVAELIDDVVAIQNDLDNTTDGLGAIKTAIDAVPTTQDNHVPY